MLTMYLDESIEANDGYVVVAGFLGNDSQWNHCMKLWTDVRGDRGPLHLRTLRGWKKVRHENQLSELGRIPAQCGLTLVYTSLRYSDYRDLIEGSFAEIAGAGYLLALFMLVQRCLLALPEGERVEVICEQLHEHSGVRESMFRLCLKNPQLRNKDGLSRLAKWSSMEKSTILEPSDYASFALLQLLRDESSRKSVLTHHILMNEYRVGQCIGRDEVRRHILEYGEHEGVLHKMGPELKKEIKAAFREYYGTQP